MPQSQPLLRLSAQSHCRTLTLITMSAWWADVNGLRLIINNSAVRNVGMRSISISTCILQFSSKGCSFKLFKEIKIVLPHMVTMKLNDLAKSQWYV